MTRTTMNRTSLSRINRNREALLVLRGASASLQKLMLEKAKRDLVLALVEIAENIIKGNVELTGEQLLALRRKKKHVGVLVNPATTTAQKKKALQVGGFLPLLLGPIASLLGSVLPSLFGRKK